MKRYKCLACGAELSLPPQFAQMGKPTVCGWCTHTDWREIDSGDEQESLYVSEEVMDIDLVGVYSKIVNELRFAALSSYLVGIAGRGQYENPEQALRRIISEYVACRDEGVPILGEEVTKLKEEMLGVSESEPTREDILEVSVASLRDEKEHALEKIYSLRLVNVDLEERLKRRDARISGLQAEVFRLSKREGK